MIRAERVLLISSTIWFFGEGMLGPLFAVFAERIGGDILDISWAWAAYLIVQGIFMMFVGAFSDHKRRKEKLMLAGYSLNALLTFTYLLVDTPEKLFLVSIGLGVAAALATPTWDALYAAHEDRKKGGRTWGIADGMATLMTGFAIVLGGYIVSEYSFSALFVSMGFVQVLAVLYQWRAYKS